MFIGKNLSLTERRIVDYRVRATGTCGILKSVGPSESPAEVYFQELSGEMIVIQRFFSTDYYRGPGLTDPLAARIISHLINLND